MSMADNALPQDPYTGKGVTITRVSTSQYGSGISAMQDTRATFTNDAPVTYEVTGNQVTVSGPAELLQELQTAGVSPGPDTPEAVTSRCALPPITTSQLNAANDIVTTEVNVSQASAGQVKVEAELPAATDSAAVIKDAAIADGATPAQAEAAAQASASQIQATTAPVKTSEELKREAQKASPSVIDLKSLNNRCYLQSMHTGEAVVFKVTPTIDESRSAQYDSISPIHHPGSIQVYKTTSSRNININVKLIARTREEATENIIYMNLIRAWVMPYYGEGTLNSDFELAQKSLGAPPDVLIFSCYGDLNFEQVPVVLASYSWTYPDDVDYIYTLPIKDGYVNPTQGTAVPCPRTIDITMTLLESYSPAEMSSFDLVSYKKGNLSAAFNGGKPRKYQASNAWQQYISGKLNPGGTAGG